MPDILRTIDFSDQLLPAVQTFNSGNEPWQTPLADWIKAGPEKPTGALYELKRSKGKLNVWLYVNQADTLVGYGSLGRSNWEWPSPRDPRVPISIIPYVAVDRNFWGEPKSDPPKYSRQILDHLIFEARKNKDCKLLLGLFVDPRNVQAIATYKKAGFNEYFRKFIDDGIEYISMLLKLVEETPAVAAAEDRT